MPKNVMSAKTELARLLNQNIPNTIFFKLMISKFYDKTFYFFTSSDESLRKYGTIPFENAEPIVYSISIETPNIKCLDCLHQK